MGAEALALEELLEFWTLLDDEREQVAGKGGSARIRLSTCLARWSRRDWRCGCCPGSRDSVAAVAVASHFDAGCAGECNSVAGKFPGARSSESTSQLR